MRFQYGIVCGIILFFLSIFFVFGFTISNKYSIVCGIFKVFPTIYQIDKKRNIRKNVMREDHSWIWEFA